MIGILESIPESKPIIGITSLYPLEADADDIVNGLDGVSTNIDYTSGAAYFDGTSSKIEVADNDNFSFDNDVNEYLLFEWEAKFDNTNSSRFIVKDGVSTEREYLIGYVGTKLSVLLFSEDGTSFIRRDYTFTPDLNTWIKFKIEYFGLATPNSIKISVNDQGVASTGSVTGTFVKMKNTTEPVAFGYEKRSNSQFFQGYMRNIKITKL